MRPPLRSGFDTPERHFLRDRNLPSAQHWGPDGRQIHYRVVWLGALPNAHTKSVPHGITDSIKTVVSIGYVAYSATDDEWLTSPNY